MKKFMILLLLLAFIPRQHGLTEQQFEQAVRKVSENPDAAKQYAAAFRKAEGR